ncbi:hypothetical protein NDU88_006964 [Pleurodeles waltl]|uniref:Uncharacterized protein n=1 Tax=Pleurodeles waltl TaxID=8319 RepID=A0AAV7MDQ9_PLEWA|nr:hypothetical protein NDU88_006964 [Pleurodeles waltl]
MTASRRTCDPRLPCAPAAATRAPSGRCAGSADPGILAGRGVPPSPGWSMSGRGGVHLILVGCAEGSASPSRGSRGHACPAARLSGCCDHFCGETCPGAAKSQKNTGEYL